MQEDCTTSPSELQATWQFALVPAGQNKSCIAVMNSHASLQRATGSSSWAHTGSAPMIPRVYVLSTGVSVNTSAMQHAGSSAASRFLGFLTIISITRRNRPTSNVTLTPKGVSSKEPSNENGNIRPRNLS